MDLETIWYEAVPYLYGIGGAVALLIRPGSGLLKVSGVLLVVAAVSVIRLRFVYRRSLYLALPTAAEAAAKAAKGANESTMEFGD